MEYRRIGRSGLKVSEFCFGTMGFGRGTDEAEARKQVDLAFDAGINFFDTADGYSRGVSETWLGNALKGRRRDAVIASKVFFPMGEKPNDSGLSRLHILEACENSLRRLQTDYIDVYYLHQPDDQTPLEESLRAMDDLVHQGKVRYIACSNYLAWRTTMMLWLSDKHGLYRVEAYQGRYNLVMRDVEQEVLTLCMHHGLGFTVYSPLAGGFLTGKYTRDTTVISGTRSAEREPMPGAGCHPNAWDILEAVQDVARELGKTPSQVALRWVAQRPGVSSVILGARTVDHLRDNLGADGWKLEPGLMKKLDAVSALPDRYPEATRIARNIGIRDAAVKMPSLQA